MPVVVPAASRQTAIRKALRIGRKFYGEAFVAVLCPKRQAVGGRYVLVPDWIPAGA